MTIAGVWTVLLHAAVRGPDCAGGLADNRCNTCQYELAYLELFQLLAQLILLLLDALQNHADSSRHSQRDTNEQAFGAVLVCARGAVHAWLRHNIVRPLL